MQHSAELAHRQCPILYLLYYICTLKFILNKNFEIEILFNVSQQISGDELPTLILNR